MSISRELCIRAIKTEELFLLEELSLLGINISALEEDLNFQSKVWITAPSTGYIHEIYVYNGQMINPEDRLMELANQQHVHLELQVLAKDVPKLKIGQQINFTIPNKVTTFNAQIEKLNPMIDKNSGTLNVHCHIEKDQLNEVIVGMFVNAEIAVDSMKLYGLPMDAVLKEGNEYYAFVVVEDQLKKQKLSNVEVYEEFISFDELDAIEMVTGGAYYIQ